MKKTLSIILAILMIVTTIHIAFAAEDTPDFSDAKVLSTNNGYLYIDGEKISVVYNTFDEPIQKIPGGKYILEGDMNSSGAYASMLSDAVSINLNGYTWDFGKKYLSLYVALSIYDTSIGETGKMTSSFPRTIDLRDGSELNLYSGTVENNSEKDYSYSLQALTGTANLYGGKLKSNKYAINCNLRNPEVINLVGTVLESGEGYGQLRTPVTLYDDEIPEIVIDVSDYNGIDLTLQLDFYGYTDYVGKYTLIKGVENAEEAEKYKIKINYPEYQPDVYVEEIGYDEATGEIYLYTATNAFTQQPSVENDYTVDFNNPDVSFQWCEVEEKNLGVYTAEEFSPLFTYEFKAGDILVISTDSEFKLVVIETGIIDTDYEYIHLDEYEKTATITFDADTTVDFFTAILDAGNPVEVNFTVFKETKLDGETEKTLQKVECGKSYYCKATAGEKVYTSDIITVDHNIVQVDAQAPTCTEIGWDAYEYCTVCDYTTYVELPADPDAHTDADNDGVCDHGCGAEVVTLGGNVYPVDGDITNTGIHIGAFAAFDNCYKAGDGYMLIKGEGNNDTVMTLYNATIDVRGTGHKDAIKVDGEDIEIRFFGENNIFADEEAYTTAIGSNRHSQTFIGADDAVLNLYGNVAVSDINIESGTVNVYGADVNDIESVYVEGYLVISEGAVLNIISGDNGQGFNCGIIAQKEIVAEGEFNAIALTGVETDNEIIYNLTAIGNAVLGADTYSPYYGMEIPEDMNVEVNFIVPEGASVTVPEGITLNLDSMTNVDIDGELIVYGTLICTHTGGEDTCDAPAVCDICKQVYGEKLTHTDEDGDYICDHGCGYEFEKPAEPTPEEPTPEEPIPEEPTPEEPTEDTICEDCGKVHDGFFAELICFFTKIINFIKNLFA